MKYSTMSYGILCLAEGADSDNGYYFQWVERNEKILWHLQASVATDVPVSTMLMNATMPMPMLTPPLDTCTDVAALRQATSVVCIVLSQGLIPPTGWLHGHTDPQNGGHPHHFPICLSRVPTIHQPHLLSATPTIPKADSFRRVCSPLHTSHILCDIQHYYSSPTVEKPLSCCMRIFRLLYLRLHFHACLQGCHLFEQVLGRHRSRYGPTKGVINPPLALYW